MENFYFHGLKNGLMSEFFGIVSKTTSILIDLFFWPKYSRSLGWPISNLIWAYSLKLLLFVVVVVVLVVVVVVVLVVVVVVVVMVVVVAGPIAAAAAIIVILFRFCVIYLLMFRV